MTTTASSCTISIIRLMRNSGQTAAQSARPANQGSINRSLAGNGEYGVPPIGGSARETRQRPFTDLVRLQRPEMLQRNREHVRQLKNLRTSQSLKSSTKKFSVPDSGSKPNATGWCSSRFYFVFFVLLMLVSKLPVSSITF
jgi:hypothetical protein